MTNTEAIKILNECRDRGFERTTYTIEEYHTARDMAIKALQEQNCDQCEVGNPCLYCEYEFKAQAEVNAHAIQSALDTGTNTAIGTCGMRDATPKERDAVDKYIKSISKPTGVNFWDLTDGEYISKEKAIIQLSWDLSEVELPRIKESLDKLPSVDIPPEHDGCKDCKYETYLEYYYPCCECKHNYNDFWKFKPHWKPYLEEGLTVQCSECGSRFEIATEFCPRCGVYNGEEIER